MGIAETELDLVSRCVRDGKFYVVRQQAIVALFCTNGLPVQLADMALSDFEAVQHEYETCLTRLKIRYDDTAMPNPPLPWQRRP